MGECGHRSRDRRVRGEHPADLVEHPWPPPSTQPATPSESKSAIAKWQLSRSPETNSTATGTTPCAPPATRPSPTDLIQREPLSPKDGLALALLAAEIMAVPR